MVLMSFFVNVGADLAKCIPDVTDKSFNNYLSVRNECSMFIDSVFEDEVVSVVSQFLSKKSKDFNDLNMYCMKYVIDVIAKPLSYICNQSFLTGVFPEKMKIAKVIPLFKAGEKNKFNNYRPVSILPQFSKILEKLFEKRLCKFCDKYNLLVDSQYGFRAGRSTAMALTELVDDVTTAIEKRMHAIGVFIDLKKAFDTISHTLLLRKLEYYGIRGTVNRWISSYLSNRQQYVQIDNCSSDLSRIKYGVPEGSILGPKLFILFINDICNVSNMVKFIIFADDTNIFCSGKDMKQLSLCLCEVLDKLRVWFMVNKLSLNVNKTNFMVFTKRKCDKNIAIKLIISL